MIKEAHFISYVTLFLSTWLTFGKDTEMNPADAYKTGMKYFVKRT